MTRACSLAFVAVVVGLLASIAPGEARASDRELSLARAVEIALAESPLIKASGHEVAEAAAGVDRSRAAFLPRLDLGESFTHSDNPVFAFSSRLNQGRFTAADFAVDRLNDPGWQSNFRTSVAVSQPLFAGGRSLHRLEGAKAGHTAATHGLERQRQEVIFAVSRAYYAVLLAEANREVVAGGLASAEANRDLARARVDAGMVVEADALSAEVRLATLREQAITTGHQTTLARAALNDAMGRPLEEAWDIRDRLEVVAAAVDERADLPALALERRPDYRRLLSEEERQEREVRAARAAFLPSLNALGSWELNTADFASNGQGSWFVGLALQWNLFNGLADRAWLTETEAGLDRMRALRARMGSAIALEVKEAALGLRSAVERIGVARGAVDQAEASLGLVQQRYGAGLTTIVDLLATEAALTQARGNLSRALHDHRVGQMRLELALGTLAKDTLR
jgi:outer membrane protein TolC